MKRNQLERNAESSCATPVCMAILSERYKRYLDLCVPEDPDPLSFSVQDQIFKSRRDQRFRLLQVGDGTSYKDVYVELESVTDHWIRLVDLEIVEGSIRRVPKRGMIRMGKTSLMGAVAHGIHSGKAFRGP